MCSAGVTLTDMSILTDMSTEVITLDDMDLNVSSTLIAFTNERLVKDRVYRVMVNASNINGSAISSADISKLDCISNP